MLRMKTAPIAIGLFTCLTALLPAQTPAAVPAFDVASIRPGTDGTVRPDLQTAPGTFTARSQSLRSLIIWAWDMPPFQTTGPAWLNDVRFDVMAKGDPKAGELEQRLMLRKLLTDRFAVKVHIEQKEMQVYAVSLAKGGPKFQESTTEGPPVFDRGGPTTLTAHRVTMKDVAIQLSEPLGRPVIDETGLKGRYDIKVDISAYLLSAANGGQGRGGGDMDVMSLLFTGLQQQLGVKLDSKKMNVDILTVDSAEKAPSDN